MLDDDPARGLRQGADATGPRTLIPTEPAKRLPSSAKGYWRTTLGINVGVALLVSMVLSQGVEELGLPAALLPALVLVLGVAAVIAVPELRWRRWRYEIRDDEIDIRHGAFTVRRTLVPIRRVQHVDTEAGIVHSMFDVAAVKFHTAAGATSIPALEKGEAEWIRRHVGELTRTRDDT